jgi:hypothetical protein
MLRRSSSYEVFTGGDTVMNTGKGVSDSLRGNTYNRWNYIRGILTNSKYLA